MTLALASLVLFALGGDTRVDTLFAPLDADGSPGASVAVVRRGELLVADGYGLAQIEHDAPITPDTPFHVASVSKQFTAFAVCLLEADGVLSLDDPVRRWVPELPDFGATITLEHLLHHTSGLRDQWEALAIAGWRLDDVITTEHILTMVANQRELNFAPGDQHLYCNTGYTLLAETVARASGKSFPEFCRERIFAPLGMERTHFHDDHERVVAERAYSYANDGAGGYRNAVLSYANAGATSLFTCATDLLAWLENLSSGRVGSPEVLARMREPYVLNDGTRGSYALGLVLEDLAGHPALSHGGADAGFRSFALWVPDQELGVAVLSNLGSVDAGALARAVGALFLEGPPPERASREPESGPEGEAEAEARAEAVESSAASTAPPARPASDEADAAIETPNAADFTGRYWSEELGTFYDLAVEDGELVARHRRNGLIRLAPSSADTYQGDRWYFGTLEFHRDEHGRVSGFRLQGGRVKNLAFARQ